MECVLLAFFDDHRSSHQRNRERTPDPKLSMLCSEYLTEIYIYIFDGDNVTVVKIAVVDVVGTVDVVGVIDVDVDEIFGVVRVSFD